MVIKFIESTYDSFKDKLKNPFYGTLFVVWLIRNREFIYNIFFNDSVTSDERLELIRAHFLNWDSLLSFIGTIFISLGLMVLIYISLNLSRFIVELSERVLRPRIQKIFSKSSIVSREDFERIEKERDHYIKLYNEQKTEKLRLQQEIDENKNLEILKTNNQFDNNSVESDDGFSAYKADLMFSKWRELGIYYNFKSFIARVNDKTPTTSFESDFREIIHELLSMNVILRDNNSTLSYYRFTPYGEKLKEYYLENFYKE